jgi:fructokinase
MAKKGVDVVVCGEVLCDLFSPRPGIALANASHLVPRLGGAPANVAVQLARLGVPTALVTAVGPDPFGERVLRQLAQEDVSLEGVRTMNGRRTGATLVDVDADGERRFFGFREASADLALTVDDVDRPRVMAMIRNARVMHSGTVSLRTDNARDATRFLQAAARRAKAIISVDVNVRPGMYPDRALLVERVSGAVASADVLKATREEAALILAKRRSTSLTRLAEGLLAHGPRLVLLTDGDQPMAIATERHIVRQPALVVRTVDATGAGDAFFGAALATLIRWSVLVDDLPSLDEAMLARVLQAGRFAGAAAVTRVGATTAMVRRLPRELAPRQGTSHRKMHRPQTAESGAAASILVREIGRSLAAGRTR